MLCKDRPVFCKDYRIDRYLNEGLFNGKTVYIHYTSEQGLKAIRKDGKISANPNRDRRGPNAKRGVYLTSAKDAMNQKKAHKLLFFCEEKYASSATHCIIFVFYDNRELTYAPITSGSSVTEVISWNDINFNQIDIIYYGKNCFI